MVDIYFKHVHVLPDNMLSTLFSSAWNQSLKVPSFSAFRNIKTSSQNTSFIHIPWYPHCVYLGSFLYSTHLYLSTPFQPPSPSRLQPPPPTIPFNLQVDMRPFVDLGLIKRIHGRLGSLKTRLPAPLPHQIPAYPFPYPPSYPHPHPTSPWQPLLNSLPPPPFTPWLSGP